jgi:hypothetical protein
MKPVQSPDEKFTRQERKAAGKALRDWLVSKLYFRSLCSQDGSHKNSELFLLNN